MMAFFVPLVLPHHRHVPMFTGWPQPPVHHKLHPPGATIGSPVPGAHMEPLHVGTATSASAPARLWPQVQPHYDKWDARSAILLLPYLPAAELPDVLQYELHHKNRKPVVEALQRGIADARYDKLSAREAIRRVPHISTPELPDVLQYERDHKNRKTVIAALQRQIAYGH
jgi:hypothetical protein